MEKYNELEKILDVNRIRYNEPMKKHTTVKVGGPCDCLVMPESIEEIKNIVNFAKENDIKYYVIGSGSNLLVTDEKIHALIIKIGNKFIGYQWASTTGDMTPRDCGWEFDFDTLCECEEKQKTITYYEPKVI